MWWVSGRRKHDRQFAKRREGGLKKSQGPSNIRRSNSYHSSICHSMLTDHEDRLGWELKYAFKSKEAVPETR